MLALVQQTQAGSGDSLRLGEPVPDPAYVLLEE